jgi:uncharacterized protein with PQ loop repeat
MRWRSPLMPDLPTGTVTFLFTGIEGSTRRWEQHPGSCARPWAATTRCGAQRSTTTAAVSSTRSEAKGPHTEGTTEMAMPLDPMTPAAPPSGADTLLRRLLGSMSVFTLLMTIPQVLTIWVGPHAAGVSILSWSAYLAAAVLWFGYGIQQHDKNIYLPCVGWIGLDAAVIVGAIVYR